MDVSRRQFLKFGLQAGAVLAFLPAGCRSTQTTAADSTEVWVNDVHSQLNPTRVRRIVRPTSHTEIPGVVRNVAADGGHLSVAGGRHAAGGQQFLTDGLLVDMRGMNRVLSLDAQHGVVEAEAGIQWPELMDELAQRQADSAHAWGIVQKQGMDRMTLGGSLGANMHGNGLGLQPIVAQIESFTLVDATGRVRKCSRTENAELFSLAVGGYGLFGIVTTMRLRLARRRKLRVEVQMAAVEDAIPTLLQRQAEGCLYGDWHYSPDASSPDFLRRGVLATYRPLEATADVPVSAPSSSTGEDWVKLVTLGHADCGKAFALFSQNALQQNGNVVWSDTFQLDRLYTDNYHVAVDRALSARVPATESLIEFFVPRDSLVAFLADVRADFLQNKVPLVYGTVRMAERDTDAFLPWAQHPCACIVFNLHVVHDAAGKQELIATYRRLVDIAARYSGTFYLTYHHYATRAQLERCHPRFPEVLRAKRRYDPREVFQSDWYRHHKEMFAA